MRLKQSWKKKKKNPRFLLSCEGARSSGGLRQERSLKDPWSGEWFHSALAFYACRTDPEPCLASPLPLRSDSRVEPQSEGTRSVGRQRGASARGASADPPAAEAKFKSHNKIVCHREAINGDGFVVDSPKVIGNLYSRCWKAKLIKTRGEKRRHSFGLKSFISEQTFLVFSL